MGKSTLLSLWGVMILLPPRSPGALRWVFISPKWKTQELGFRNKFLQIPYVGNMAMPFWNCIPGCLAVVSTGCAKEMRLCLFLPPVGVQDVVSTRSNSLSWRGCCTVWIHLFKGQRIASQPTAENGVYMAWFVFLSIGNCVLHMKCLLSTRHFQKGVKAEYQPKYAAYRQMVRAQMGCSARSPQGMSNRTEHAFCLMMVG